MFDLSHMFVNFHETEHLLSVQGKKITYCDLRTNSEAFNFFFGPHNAETLELPWFAWLWKRNMALSCPLKSLWTEFVLEFVSLRDNKITKDFGWMLEPMDRFRLKCYTHNSLKKILWDSYYKSYNVWNILTFWILSNSYARILKWILTKWNWTLSSLVIITNIVIYRNTCSRLSVGRRRRF